MRWYQKYAFHNKLIVYTFNSNYELKEERGPHDTPHIWLLTRVPHNASRAKYVGGLRQVLSLFDKEDATLEEFLVQLVEDGLLSKAFNLPIMNQRLPWTEKMMDGYSVTYGDYLYSFSMPVSLIM